MIQFLTEDVAAPALDKSKVKRWVGMVVAGYGKRPGKLNYIFCSDERILEVNRQFLQHDYFTDIISFDYSSGKVISGDIFISLDSVRTNAEEFGVEIENELHRVMIHGVLHFCGEDDETEEQEAQMRQKEDEALMLLKGLRA